VTVIVELIVSKSLPIIPAMPRCEGRPNEPCPGKINNATVKLTKGDLLLCKDCDMYRFPPAAVAGKVATLSDSVTAANNCSKVSEAHVIVPVRLDEGVADKNQETARKLAVCEVLCFLDNKYDNHPISVLKSVISNFYREDEIISAKQILIQAIDSSHHVYLNTYLRKRIGDNRMERSCDDIVCIFKYVDENNLRSHLPLFCAVSLERVPDIPDEMSDLTSIRHNVNEVLDHLHLLKESVSSIKPVVLEISDISVQTRNLLLTTAKCGSPQAQLQPASVSGPAAQVTHILEDLSASNVVSGSSEPMDAGDAHSLCSSVPAVNSNSSSEAIVPTMADMVKKPAAQVQGNLPANDTSYQTVYRKQKKKKTIVGNGTASAPFTGVMKKAVICVNRLACSVSTDTVTSFLQDNGVVVHSCYEVHGGKGRATEGSTGRLSSDSVAAAADAVSKLRNYNMMRICVSQSDLPKVMSEHLWPSGVTVRPWSFKAKTLPSRD